MPKLFTFIVNEITEVQWTGHSVVLVPIYKIRSSAIHQRTFDSMNLWAVLSAPLFDLRVAVEALWTVLSHPIRVLRVLTSLHWASGRNPYAHVRLLAITPKALSAAWRLRRLQVDHIHAHFATDPATFAAITSHVSGIPFSFTAHAYDIYCTTSKARNDTLPWKLRHARRILVVSKHETDLLRQRLTDNSERIQTVYVGIPLMLFKQVPPHPMDGALRVLCIANFIKKKGLDTLIDACALLRDRSFPFQLKIFGDGPLRHELVRQVDRLNLGNYISVGYFIPQQQVAVEMAACHVFVMPCRKDEETGNMDGIPTVFMEAMATGRPVISCPVSGVPELVRDGDTGLLVPPNNPAELAAAVKRIANDEPLRLRTGSNARALVERQHDQRVNSRRMLSLISWDSESQESAAEGKLHANLRADGKENPWVSAVPIANNMKDGLR